MTEESPLLRDSKSTPAIDQKEIKDPATITKDAKRFSFMERLGHYKAEIAKNKDILMPTLSKAKISSLLVHQFTSSNGIGSKF